MKLSKKWLAIIGVVVAIALFAAFGLNRKPNVQYFTQKVDKGDIREVVEATGTINAVINVQVGSQVSGTIDKLYADFNSHVKNGQVIAQLDQSLFQGALLQAKADLENANANLASSRANLEKNKAMLAQAKADYDRTVPLVQQGVFSQQQLDLAKANYDSAIANLGAANATVTQATAQVSQKRAAVSVAQTNLDHTVIRAPVDGVVTNRNVDVGQTVAAAMQAPTLFTIAQDLTKMLVYTKTDESDVGMIHPGQPVTFKVDAFPRDVFRGNVSQVRMNATTVQNVVTYDTIVAFDNPDTKLFPGMTAYVTIPVAFAQSVMKIPNGAIRYKPDLTATELRARLQKAGIDNGGQGGGGTRAAKGQAAGDAQGGAQGSAQGGAQGSPQAANPGAPGGGQGQGGGQRFRGAQGGQGGDTPGGGSAGGGQSREPRLDVAIIWKKLPDNTLVPVQVRTGITDHTVTEIKQVLHGDLKDGDDVIVGQASGSSASRPPGMGGPGMGGGRPPGR